MRARPLEYGRAGAGGVLEFWVNGSDATWSAAAQGRLGGSAELVDLITGVEWRVRWERRGRPRSSG